MGTVTALDLIQRANKTLNDIAGTRWDNELMLDALNVGQREVVRLKPDAYLITETVKLVSGIKQTIPAGRMNLHAVTRNMGTDGSTPGDVVTYVPKDTMDQYQRGWTQATSAATVVHFTLVRDQKKTFYVFPPQPSSGQGYVEIECVGLPADVGLTDPITLDDEYQDAMYYYMMSYALTIENKAADKNKAAGFYTMFTNALGMQSQGEKMTEAAR